MKAACKQCPFRVGSALGYDHDAMAALEDGDVPACHAVVGIDGIFNHAPMNPPEGASCAGHDLWEVGEPGYQTPILTEGQP